MNLKKTIAAALVVLSLASCVSYKSYERAKEAEKVKDWDVAVAEYEKALEIDPSNTKYRIAAQRARLEASRSHFAKAKTLRAAAEAAAGEERLRLAELAATELQLAVKLDSTNQFAGVELGHTIRMIQEEQGRLRGDTTIEEMKKRANITKAQPPTLNPGSDQPISLTFPRETPVKEIYRALGNAYGINILFDQAIKDDRVAIELKDVTAQEALERVMQAVNHFYKALDDHTIIVIPDNPQARRDYEDLVIRTFYLSNGDAEQVTNVVRTMIEARNVFPLKALNAITIRDTADKVKIAEKIIEANDKAKAEVVVDVELLQMDLDKTRDLGFAISGGTGLPVITTVPRSVTSGTPPVTSTQRVPITGPGSAAATIDELRQLTTGSFSFSIPTPSYSLLKSISNAELLAHPQLRISEGEKASLHIGQRIPVPVTTFTTAVQGGSQLGSLPATSYQYQDVGIKVNMEPRVHHNREVTLKLTVEVSNLGPNAAGTGANGVAAQPSFGTRSIESTIRLKDGETNFLAGLIQQNTSTSDAQTPFLSDIPFLGRLFTQNHRNVTRTDLVMTMTPHIVRIPDITEDDLAPMWVGTQNNLSFRGLSPRVESQINIDPFAPRPVDPFSAPGAAQTPVNAPGLPNTQGSTPLGTPPGTLPGPNPRTQPPPNAQPQMLDNGLPPGSPNASALMASVGDSAPEAPAKEADLAALRLAPRISPQPANLRLKPGEEKSWNVVGMDIDGLSANEIVLHYDPRSIDVSGVVFGDALTVDPMLPPVATVNPKSGVIRVKSSDGKPLNFASGGTVISLRVRGTLPGEALLVLENPLLRSATGGAVTAAVTGGRARVE